MKALKNFGPIAFAVLLLLRGSAAEQSNSSINSRRPSNEADLRYWLENMALYHRFSTEEIVAATGLSSNEVISAMTRFGLDNAKLPKRKPDAPLLVLPYPGGRHPRIGFLKGAINPQRETKVSAFTPWDAASYVVVDVPEAIWSNLGLTYLAHTDIDTIWTRKGVTLSKLEWKRRRNGVLEMERTLPNHIAFGTKVTPQRNGVAFELWLRNGTREMLRDLRVQNCVMLKGAAGFNQQTSTNKVFAKPYAAVRSEDGRRWIICGFEPCDRTWDNDQVPCLHSDPKFSDCPPGETKRIHGWLWFYEGDDIHGEFKRLDQTKWKEGRGWEDPYAKIRHRRLVEACCWVCPERVPLAADGEVIDVAQLRPRSSHCIACWCSRGRCVGQRTSAFLARQAVARPNCIRVALAPRRGPLRCVYKGRMGCMNRPNPRYGRGLRHAGG
jgi:hypothetical protein